IRYTAPTFAYLFNACLKDPFVEKMLRMRTADGLHGAGRISLWDYESSEKLQKMREIALRRPKMRTDHPRVKENKLWCRQEDVKSCVFVNYLENGRKD
ncbi:hypothetical protein ALC53_00858, partial [Atta colombica]